MTQENNLGIEPTSREIEAALRESEQKLRRLTAIESREECRRLTDRAIR
jgi:hypothetical protein